MKTGTWAFLVPNAVGYLALLTLSRSCVGWLFLLNVNLNSLRPSPLQMVLTPQPPAASLMAGRFPANSSSTILRPAAFALSQVSCKFCSSAFPEMVGAEQGEGGFLGHGARARGAQRGASGRGSLEHRRGWVGRRRHGGPQILSSDVPVSDPHVSPQFPNQEKPAVLRWPQRNLGPRVHHWPGAECWRSFKAVRNPENFTGPVWSQDLSLRTPLPPPQLHFLKLFAAK